MKKVVVYLNDIELEAWKAVKRIYIEECQLPTAKALAPEINSKSDQYAGRILTSLREKGLIVRNTMGGWRFSKQPVEIRDIKELRRDSVRNRKIKA